MGGMTALLFAARDGKPRRGQGPRRVRSRRESGERRRRGSPINIAIANGHYTVGKYLLDHGANPNLRTSTVSSALRDGEHALRARVLGAESRRTSRVSARPSFSRRFSKGREAECRVKGKLWFSPTSTTGAGWTTKGDSVLARGDVERRRGDAHSRRGGADPNLDGLRSHTAHGRRGNRPGRELSPRTRPIRGWRR
jgi:hypothetical protein